MYLVKIKEKKVKSMEAYEIFKDLALIILAAELFGLLAKKLKAPQVVGQIIAGLIIGPAVLGIVNTSDFIGSLAEVGVMLIMFSAGLETNLKDLMKTGLLALIVACVGVFVPLIGGYLLYSLYHFGRLTAVGTPEFYESLFIGTIMTATSVGITVQVLKEMGKLKTRVGTLILSAAIIDDIIGIVVLTFVISLAGGSDSAGGIADLINANMGDVAKVIVNVLLFFVFTILIGILIYKIFKLLNKKYSHHRRLPIFGLAFAMLMAFCAEKLFGIADITGAYAAGIILCSLKDSDYVAAKMDISSYMIFGPVFFVNIGLKTQFDGLDSNLLVFAILFVIVALIAKIIGCGVVAKIAKYSWGDSLKVGIGMMTRGEVALIVASKGLAAGIMDQKYFAAVILLIICSSIVSPIILKVLFKKDKHPDDENDGGGEITEEKTAEPAPVTAG